MGKLFSNIFKLGSKGESSAQGDQGDLELKEVNPEDSEKVDAIWQCLKDSVLQFDWEVLGTEGRNAIVSTGPLEGFTEEDVNGFAERINKVTGLKYFSAHTDPENPSDCSIIASVPVSEAERLRKAFERNEGALGGVNSSIKRLIKRLINPPEGYHQD